MASWSDVRRIALALPETDEHGSHRGGTAWRVPRKHFVWERPLGKKDVADLGGEAPDGPVLGVQVADEGVKWAIIEGDPDVFFTIPHFDGYPAVLVRLDRIAVPLLREIVTEAWLERAPAKLAKEYEARLTGGGEVGLPAALSAPAARALGEAGYGSRHQLDGVSQRELLALHGVGPKAVEVLSDALSDQGLGLS